MTRSPRRSTPIRTAVLKSEINRAEICETFLIALAFGAALIWMFAFSANVWGATTTFNAASGGGTFNWSSPTTWVENPLSPDGDDDMSFNVSGKTVVYDAAAVETGGGFGANSITQIRLSTLRLDKNLKVTGNVNVIRDGTLNLNGRQLTVGAGITFGDAIGVPTFVNNGPLVVTGQVNIDNVGTQSIVLNGDDSMGSLRLRLSTAVAIAGNVPVGGNIDMLRNAMITFNNASRLSAVNASLGDAQGYGRIAGFAGSTLDLSGNLTFTNGQSSQLSMSQVLNDTQGLTLELDGTLNLGTTGQILLTFDNNTTGGALAGNPANFDWAFRWFGNHEAQLESLAGTRLIVSTGGAPVTFNAANNIFFASDGYTYVGFAVAESVPEPSTWALATLGLVGLAGWTWRKHSHRD